MENFYRTLGVSSAASADEIRRAYRILARRYHPDVNPGKASEDHFKKIAAAYAVLSDNEKKRAFDGELERTQANFDSNFGSSFEKAHAAYRRQQQTSGRQHRTTTTTYENDVKPGTQRVKNKEKTFSNEKKEGLISGIQTRFSSTLAQLKSSTPNKLAVGLADSILRRKKKRLGSQLSIIEVSITIFDAISGAKKTVELLEGETSRKISVTIPVGVRNGSVVRFKKRENEDSDSNSAQEEIVLIVRVATHPSLSMTQKGLVLSVPLSVSEAVKGARIKVPTLDEPVGVNVEPGTQSGHEVRLKGQGVTYRDGKRGDLFIRFMISIPEGTTTESSSPITAASCADALDAFYAKPVREDFPEQITDFAV